MENKKFIRLLQYLYSEEFSVEQRERRKLVINDLKIVEFEKVTQGYHIPKLTSDILDILIEQGASLTECMRECNVSKTTVLRHRKKLQLQKEQEEKHRQEVLQREDTDLEKIMLMSAERLERGELPFI